MTMEDVEDNWDEIYDMLGSWSIWSLLDGKVDGHGYGNNITPGTGYQVSCLQRWTLVMSDDGRPDQGLDDYGC